MGSKAGANGSDGSLADYVPLDDDAHPPTTGFTIKCCKRNCLDIPLSNGVKKRNLLTYLFAVYTSITLFVFINAVAPYVLTNYLNIPQDSQGVYSGNLAVFNEIPILATIIAFGLLSDKTGRMPVFTFAIAAMGFILALHNSYTIKSWPVLVILRVCFGLGASGFVAEAFFLVTSLLIARFLIAAGAMVTAVLADYPKDVGRGKVGGAVGLAAGAGALTAVFVFLHIPAWTKLDNLRDAGDIMFFVVGGFSVICAVLIGLGLKKGPVEGAALINVRQMFLDGFKSIKSPEVLLAFFSSYAARGDSVVITTFISLWVHKYYVVNNLPSDKGLAKGGEISGIAQTMAIVAAPFIGVVADRVSRVITVAFCGVVGFVGYGLMYFTTNPESALIYISSVLIGIAEIGMVISSQVLIAQVAPPDARGNLSGFFGIFASIGIIIATKFGGWLFDNWSESGPFVIFSVFNLLVAIFALVLFLYRRKHPIPTDEAAAGLINA